MFGVFWEPAFHGRSRARALDDDVHRVFLMCGVLTLGVWLCYPIAWGVAEGGNVIAPDSEAVFYGVLDFLAKPVSHKYCSFCQSCSRWRLVLLRCFDLRPLGYKPRKAGSSSASR